MMVAPMFRNIPATMSSSGPIAPPFRFASRGKSAWLTPIHGAAHHPRRADACHFDLGPATYPSSDIVMLSRSFVIKSFRLRRARRDLGIIHFSYGSLLRGAFGACSSSDCRYLTQPLMNSSIRSSTLVSIVVPPPLVRRSLRPTLGRVLPNFPVGRRESGRDS